MKKLLFIFLFPFIVFAQEKNYPNWVNPFIGTGGHGHTYPGVSEPFGFIQLSPDSRLDGWDGCSGYHYSDSLIYGFSHTHLSGTGVSDYGDILVMPFIRERIWENGVNSTQSYASAFHHHNEKAEAGYYSVLLDRFKIKAELTTTTRCGIHKYTYPKQETKKIIIDLEHRDKMIDSDLFFLNDSTLVGKRISNAWAKEQHIYFVIQFSELPKERFYKKDENNKTTKIILEFSDKNPELYLKIGISAVDLNGAKNNLKKEIPHWDFELIKKQNQEKWQNELRKIEITTTDERYKQIFYTALYHSFLNPNTFSDVDGRFRGTDLKIHHAATTQYTVFSLWDTFRAAHPLYTITQEEKTLAFIQTFLNHYKYGGRLPVWELGANETDCMIGYHSVPVIVDAYMKGIRDFNHEFALEAMMHSAELNHLGLKYYMRDGYISSEYEAESVSKTLEYAYDDWCIAIFADSLGKDSIAKIYYNRAQYYKNIFNPETKFMQPKFNGAFVDKFKPEEVTFNYTEANSWQYSLFAPQDIKGLIKLIGGKAEFEYWLDCLFNAESVLDGRHQVDITGLIGQYAHGNEPSHHMAYLYNYTDNNHKTQYYVHKILTELYSENPDGLCGNEDCGQMSAWYVLSSMGFYPVTPGSNIYLLGTPLFEKSKLNLENGNVFEIEAKNLSYASFYVKSVSLNGQNLNRNYIYHHEIMNGGKLVFEMSDQPQKNYGSSNNSSIEQDFLIVPYTKNPKATFEKKLKIEMRNPNPEGRIYYSIKYPKIKVYKKPFKIKEDEEIEYWVQNDSIRSNIIRSSYKKVNYKWDIELVSSHHKQYSGGSEKALIDQQLGGNDFRTGYWQGFYAQNMVVIIDMKKAQIVQSISVRLLQDANSWIWFPEYINFYTSNDKITWKKVGTANHTIPKTQYGSLIEEMGINCNEKARYIKVEAKNIGDCPAWHPGAGNASFIFADEIFVK